MVCKLHIILPSLVSLNQIFSRNNFIHILHLLLLVCSQIIKHCHIFKGAINYLQTTVLSSTFITIHDQIVFFAYICSQVPHYLHSHITMGVKIDYHTYMWLPSPNFTYISNSLSQLASSFKLPSFNILQTYYFLFLNLFTTCMFPY
jgi:hypothetical protein